MKNNKSEVTPLRGYSEESIFYVYAHKRPIVGTVFYIGKGHGNRAWVTKDRNPHWKNVVNKNNGFDVEIIKDGMTEQEAFAFEVDTILNYGIENLTNQTLGGISTTGYRHTEDTRKLQSQIAKQRMIDNPEYAARNTDRIIQLAESQTDEFRNFAISRAIETTRNYSPEEHAAYVARKTEWLNDSQKKAAANEKRKQHPDRDQHLENLSVRMKLYWQSMTEQERLVASERSKSVIMREDVRKKILEKACKKLVVNRKFVFKSTKDFLTLLNYTHTAFANAVKRAEKCGCTFFIAKSLFVEYYTDADHNNLPEYNGEELQYLDFDVLPRSKAVVMDEDRVFLSMKEASIYCNGSSIEATADFITKNIRLKKPAMGHVWRVATNEEIIREVLKRLGNLHE